MIVHRLLVKDHQLIKDRLPRADLVGRTAPRRSPDEGDNVTTPATSRDNPWIQALWMLALLGVVAGGAALFIGYQSATATTAAPDGIVIVLIPVGAAVLGASLVALALGFAVSAHLWEGRNSE